MRRKTATTLAVLTLGILGVASTSFAGRFNRVVNIGDKAPNWENLIGIDDQKHSLDDYNDAKLLVVIFTCNHCPVATAYEDRIVEFAKDYKDKGVQVVAINVNNIEADRLPKMKERAEEKGFDFPYLYDSSQKTGRAYGATVTPHVFVLDQNRKIAYMGAVDDENHPARVKRRYLRDAVDALLQGSQPEVKESLQRGCTILYE